MSRAELQVGPVLGAGSARAHECLGGGGSSGPGAGPARGGPSGGGRAEAAAGRGARGTAAERASERARRRGGRGGPARAVGAAAVLQRCDAGRGPGERRRCGPRGSVSRGDRGPWKLFPPWTQRPGERRERERGSVSVSGPWGAPAGSRRPVCAGCGLGCDGTVIAETGQGKDGI